MFKVFQIKLPEEVTNYVNSNGRGHAGGEEKYPIYETYMRLNHSIRDENKMNNTDFQHYTNVCVVKKDAGLVDGDGNSWLVDCLEGVFAVLNGRYYDDDTGEDIVHDAHVSGYKMKTFERDGKTHEYRDMHSLSVGDIVYDVDKDTYNIVDSFGYKDVTAEIIANISGEVLNEVS